MKNIFKILLILPLLFFSSQIVLGEESITSEETKVNQYFELEILFDSQNPLTKSLQYTLVITPKINSPETQITWDLPSVLKPKPKHKEFVSLVKGETYSYNVEIEPQREGIYDITADVTAWQNQVNYTNSVSTTVTLNQSLVSQPVDSSYTVSLILFVVAILAIFGVIIIFAFKLSTKGIERLRKWLTPPY